MWEAISESILSSWEWHTRKVEKWIQRAFMWTLPWACRSFREPAEGFSCPSLARFALHTAASPEGSFGHRWSSGKEVQGAEEAHSPCGAAWPCTLLAAFWCPRRSGINVSIGLHKRTCLKRAFYNKKDIVYPKSSSLLCQINISWFTGTFRTKHINR